MRRPRHLSPEERDLWSKVARTTQPLENRTTVQAAAPSAKKAKPQTQTEASPFRLGQSVNHSADHDLLPSLAEQLADAPGRMDQKKRSRMKRGKLRPDARIDLHGMTLAQAHPALTGFLLSSYDKGHRLVLVITGKGKDRDDGGPIPTRFGVLRHQVPQWLRLPPLAQIVLQVSEAHQRHGGQGAYYVYLGRRR